MTGKDLIIYILQNNLEGVDLYEEGTVLGYIPASEAASKFCVGETTIYVWVNQGKMKGVRINDQLYVPYNVTDPRDDEKTSLLNFMAKENQLNE